MSHTSGYVDGLHYTNHVEAIKGLRRARRTDEAIALLLKCVAATEEESRVQGIGVAPWYYEQLAILYRREKRLVDEVSILERYALQRKAPGVLPEKLSGRLVKSKRLLSRSQTDK